MTNCKECYHSRFVAGFDQPVGCLIHDITFAQSCPQPTSCPDFIPDDVEDFCPDCSALIYPVNSCKCQLTRRS